MTALDEARLLCKLFDGRTDIYGVAKGHVVRGEVTPRLYLDHLRGGLEADLGIYLVRDDDTVTFAAVDIDEPNFELAKEVAEFLPTDHAWIERSRSGNYHVFVFFDEPLDAWAARAVLKGTVLAVGRPDLEIFPKQDGLLPGMVGNYISIPWHGDERPIVWASGFEEGLADSWPRAEFLHGANQHRTSAENWRQRGRALGGKPRAESNAAFGSRSVPHRCATYILEHRDDNPIQPGHRSIVLFNVAKQFLNCSEYDADETLELVEAINQASPAPMPTREVQRFVRNAAAGGWTSTGCDDPAFQPYADPLCPIANG